MAEIIFQPPSKDAYFLENSPGVNVGTAADLYLRPKTDNIRRIILEFPLAGIPVAAVINLATLALFETYNDKNEPIVWAYKLSRTDWVEIEATWLLYKTGSPWTTPGGDYVTVAPAGDSSLAIPDALLDDWLYFDVTAIVQDAVDAAVAAEFLIRLDSEAGALTRSVVFRSKECGVDAERPKLTVDYTPSVAGLENKSAGMAAKMVAAGLI
ncbi:hypothetical protein ES708_32118 [subsurface metagenome]